MTGNNLKIFVHKNTVKVLAKSVFHLRNSKDANGLPKTSAIQTWKYFVKNLRK
jgi:hypothetical protein